MALKEAADPAEWGEAEEGLVGGLLRGHVALKLMGEGGEFPALEACSLALKLFDYVGALDGFVPEVVFVLTKLLDFVLDIFERYVSPTVEAL